MGGGSGGAAFRVMRRGILLAPLWVWLLMLVDVLEHGMC
jgi:hypothetical protein